ncbi:MAG: OmpA family protein [Flavobacteriales bacterium]|nr:OmpA family protein [Flavobacteriales bacterium]
MGHGTALLGVQEALRHSTAQCGVRETDVGLAHQGIAAQFAILLQNHLQQRPVIGLQSGGVVLGVQQLPFLFVVGHQAACGQGHQISVGLETEGPVAVWNKVVGRLATLRHVQQQQLVQPDLLRTTTQGLQQTTIGSLEEDPVVRSRKRRVPSCLRRPCGGLNWDLSASRATAIARVLQNDYNVAPSRITAGARSEYVPLADNDTAEGRSTNRRIRIVILPKLDQFYEMIEQGMKQASGE